MGVGKTFPQTTPADVWAYPTREITEAWEALIDVAISSRLGKTPVLVDIRLNGGTTQVLVAGLYSCVTMSDAYAPNSMEWIAAHIETFAGGAWYDWATVSAAGALFPSFIADGANLRFANGAAAGTWLRLVGVRI